MKLPRKWPRPQAEVIFGAISPPNRDFRALFHEMPSPRPNFLFNAQFGKHSIFLVYQSIFPLSSHLRANSGHYFWECPPERAFSPGAGILKNNARPGRALSAQVGIKYIYIYIYIYIQVGLRVSANFANFHTGKITEKCRSSFNIFFIQLRLTECPLTYLEFPGLS